MKVTKLHIDEYKVFKDFDVDFTDKEGNAQNLIVLAGINGTGKTTLLEYIFITIIKRFTYFGTPHQDGNFVELYHKSTDMFIPQTIQSISENFTRVFGDKRKLDEKVITFNDSHGDIHLFKVRKYEFDDYVPEDEEKNYLNYSNTEIGIVKAYIDKHIYDEQLRSNEVYEALSNFINTILADFTVGFKFKRYGSEGELYFITSQNIEISLDDLSTGERQLLNFALRLFVANIKDSIILIDEPEFSLHPSWQNKIVNVLQKYSNAYNCQVIVATHSPHVIGSVHPEQLRLLYKDESGSIKVRQYIDGSYGWTADRVLMGLMDIGELRTPDVANRINELISLIHKNEYDTAFFREKFKEAETLIGYSDSDLVRMRFEIAKRKKESATNH